MLGKMISSPRPTSARKTLTDTAAAAAAADTIASDMSAPKSAIAALSGRLPTTLCGYEYSGDHPAKP